MIKKTIAILLIIGAIFWSFSALLPSSISDIDTPDNQFSSQRALIHLKEISKNPHYLGAPEHSTVREYLIRQLENLGLETAVQEGYSYGNKWGALAKSKNIIARIKGHSNSKALLLLSHYDSKSHASLGASDAGSGVVTILEGVRAFLESDILPENDIIILFTDAEELGLNGANLFVNKHPWAKNVGLVLNFEARGSGGPSFTLIETNGGNQKLISEYNKAGLDFPVANSLAYSIYKMLPNDTDLTRFREDGNINGFNFAFIDDHFDYHTALDNYERLDRETLEHQGSYLMPLLNHFSTTDLSNTSSKQDYVYTNLPLFKMIAYPFSWIFPTLIIAFIGFFVLVYVGIQKQKIKMNEVGKGFAALLLAVVSAIAIGYFGWKLILAIYPEYNLILQGFPYNGHSYIWAFVFLTLAPCFFIYSKLYNPKNTASLLVAPITLWLLICTVLAIHLKGGSFFVIPVYFAIISLWVYIRQSRPNIIGMAALGIPSLWIFTPFVAMLPIGLGMKTIMASCLLVALNFGLLISVFGRIRQKGKWSVVILIIALGYLISAHTSSDFTEEQPKPTSLAYVLDLDKKEAIWASYDPKPDSWNAPYLTKNQLQPSEQNLVTFGSKYDTGFSLTSRANIKPLALPYIEFETDTIIENERHVKVFISPQRKINRFEFFADTSAVYISFKVNGHDLKPVEPNTSVFAHREGERLFSFHISDESLIELEFTTPKEQTSGLKFYEISYDLLNNKLFEVPERPSNKIPTPFVINDAVIITKTIALETNN
ncbi:MAG: peptidase M28 [Bacteroidetes bacterium MedPE-SWsnd-G2]|nr:MAG: peptidase M28 [Bacteroidetes bacterium MedPE-SWsnd-G2]